MTGLVLAFAALYALPMQQQAMACGGGCHGGGKKSGGSLVNVENIGNVEDNNVKIGNVKTGHILSGNEIKALNNNNIGNLKDINVLSKNYLKDINVLSKNKDVFNHNYFDTLSDNLAGSDFLDNIVKNNNLDTKILNTDILNSYYKEICGC